MGKFLAGVVILLLHSCSGNQGYAPQQKKYVELLPFIEQLQVELENNKAFTYTKSVTVNGQTETKKLAGIDWKADLEIFKAFDINKPAWQSSFQQTVQELPLGKQTRLTAIDSLPQVKDLWVVHDGSGKVTAVFARRRVKNLLYDLTQEVHFYRDSLYRLMSYQKVWLLGNKEISFETRFVRK